MAKYVLIGVVVVSLILSVYVYSKIEDKQKSKKEIVALIAAQLVPLAALIVPMIVPEEGTKIFFPEVEAKIDENNALKEEIGNKDDLIVKNTEEIETLKAKISDLNEQNYADLKKADLVENDLQNSSQASIALINDTVYVNQNLLSSSLDTDVTYDELDNILYIGGTGQQVTKEALIDDYSILYSGESYVNLGVDNDSYSTTEYKVGGEELANGFVIENSNYSEAYVLIRLDGKYSSIEFDVGKLDSSTGYQIKDATLQIYLDGTPKDKETVQAQITSQHFQFDVTGAKTLKIGLTKSSSEFGFYNVIFNK
ncbi:NPCBM/NEW2 domain-containing protein [Enterococcus sp. HY326]|uniref:NPCBM/NEW2 domain-containing protein n=1 Tax=Enterococcus sp. HY326 TaxID=2971265 RepID=UPI002240796F|nr:NPCBM/NEW2 domain-containing protein [Enterococcus sp. HY326]